MSDPKIDVVDSEPASIAAPVGEAVNENGNGDSVTDVMKNEKISRDEQGAESIEKKPESDAKFDTEESKTNGHYKSKQQKPKGKYDQNRSRGKGSKFDPSILPESNDAALIRNQVEFYFGDSNLPTDTFLWDATEGSSNKPVPVKTVANFGRMKRFKPYSAIVAALKESTALNITGEEGAETVARKIPYNVDQAKHPSLARSVYVKGFGEEVASSQFDIEAFFTPYGPTNAVRLRRNDDKEFKGSVFVEFVDEETSEKFLALDPKPLWQGKELQIMSKKEYEDMRTQEIKDGTREPNATRTPKSRGRGTGHRSHGGNRDRGDRDPDDWKKRREDDQKAGFRDGRGDRNRHHNGRGGRGHGDKGDRRPRDNDRNRERQQSEIKAVSKEESKGGENDKKRAREDDTVQNEVPSKKVDTKEEFAADAS